MKNLIVFSIVNLIPFFVFSQQISVVNPNNSNTEYAIKGTLSNLSGGAFGSGVRGQNLSTTFFGIGVHGTHDGSGIGVLGEGGLNGYGVVGGSTGANGTGGNFSNSEGLALKTDGKLLFGGNSITPSDGRVLTATDLVGNARWEDMAIYTNWATLNTAWTTGNLDGTLCKINSMPLNCLDPNIVNKGKVKVYINFGGSAVRLPYTSFAGGAPNTIWFAVSGNEILLYRTTHNVSVAADLVGISASLQYRVVIIPGKSICSANAVFNNEVVDPCRSSVPCITK